MNPVQQANEALGTVLGAVGRAVWLAVRVDDQPIGRVAKEFKISVGKVRDILASGDYAASFIRIKQPQQDGTYHPNYGGFHAAEEG